MRTINYTSIRSTLPAFKQRRMALVHGTKMLLLLFLAGFSWQSSVANISSTRDGNSPTHISGITAPPPGTATYYTTASFITADPTATEPAAGDQITYITRVTNTGGAIANFRFVDTIPAYTTFGNAQYGENQVAGVVSHTMTLAAGASATFSFTVTVNSPVLPTTAYIRHTSYVDLGDGILLPAPANSASTPLPAPGEYAINTSVYNGYKGVAWKTQDFVATGSNGYVQAGDSIHYTIWIRNTGDFTLTNLVVTDFVPSYTGFYRALDGGVYNGTDNNVTWTISSLPAGGQTSVTFVVRVATDLTGASGIENSATVDYNNGKAAEKTAPVDVAGTGPGLPSNGPSTYIPIKSITSFETWKTWLNETDNNSRTVGPGEEITFLIYVRNTGNISIAALTINDLIPTGTSFKDVKDGGAYNPSTTDGGTVSWGIENIAAGAVSTVHFTVTVDKFLQGLKNITNTALVNKGDTVLETLGCDPQDPTCDGKKGTVIPLAGTRADLFISNVVTPNGDGKNDFFIVRGITEKYPGSALYIYNRWGNEVYQSKNYSNSWGASGLSEGTYYYILDLNDGGTIKKYQGWVMIIR